MSPAPLASRPPGSAAPGAAASLLVSDLLGLGDRPVLRDLARWAGDLGRDLRRQRAQGDIAGITTTLNQYALIEMLLGHPGRAEAACLAQLRWVVRLAGGRGDQRILAHAAQPWVNLGRIHRRNGQAARARRHFGLIHAWLRGEDAFPAEWAVAGGGLQALLAADATLVEVLWAVAIVDGFKTLIGCGQEAAALARIARQRSAAPPAFHHLLTEAEVVALARQGRIATALETCRRSTAPLQAGAALLVHRIALLAADQRCEEARAWASRLAAVLVQPELTGIAAPALLRLRLHLGDQLVALGETAYAVALWRCGHQQSDQLGDQRHALGFAQRLCGHDADPLVWPAVAAALRRRCAYADAGGPRGADPRAVQALRAAAAEVVAGDACRVPCHG